MCDTYLITKFCSNKNGKAVTSHGKKRGPCGKYKKRLNDADAANVVVEPNDTNADGDNRDDGGGSDGGGGSDADNEDDDNSEHNRTEDFVASQPSNVLSLQPFQSPMNRSTAYDESLEPIPRV